MDVVGGEPVKGGAVRGLESGAVIEICAVASAIEVVVAAFDLDPHVLLIWGAGYDDATGKIVVTRSHAGGAKIAAIVNEVAPDAHAALRIVEVPAVNLCAVSSPRYEAPDLGWIGVGIDGSSEFRTRRFTCVGVAVANG